MLQLSSMEQVTEKHQAISNQTLSKVSLKGEDSYLVWNQTVWP